MAAFSYNNYSPPSLFLVSDPLSNIIPNASNYLHQSSPVLQNDPINSISDQSVITHHSLHSTSPTSLSMEITQQLERKRKKSDSYKDECKWKKQKQCGEGMSKSRQDKVENRERAKIGEAEYIHVRARRGEATDSHSLAERVRREKISQRMRLLQSLVPGCDKIKGKALILDEIISYIQSLQNHVEFLAEKLASVYPMLNDFEMDLELNTLTTEQMPEKFSQLGSCIFSCHTI